MLVSSCLLLGACSAPVRAPVVSRERGSVAKPPSRPAASPTHYRVVKGDTLYSISWRFGFSHQSLARWNGLASPYTIYPGQKLRLYPVATRSPQRVVIRSSPKATPTVKQKSASVATKAPAAVTKERAATGKVVQKSEKYQKSLKLRWGWPTRGTLVQHFAKGDPMRKGVKLRGSPGQPIKAAEAGKVVYAGSGLVGYGRLIIVKHSKSYLSAYGLNRKILVKEGDQVSKGMRIAEMGVDGKGSAQLHFEIRRNGSPVNPLALLPRSN